VVGVVVVGDVVPAEEGVVGVDVVSLAVVAAVPAALGHGAQQVAGVNAAVAVIVPHLARVGRRVPVVEVDQAVAVRIADRGLEDGRVVAAGRARLGEPLRRDGGLVDPDVEVQVGVVVVDAGVGVGDDDLGGAGREVPRGRHVDAVGGVGAEVPLGAVLVL